MANQTQTYNRDTIRPNYLHPYVHENAPNLRLANCCIILDKLVVIIYTNHGTKLNRYSSKTSILIPENIMIIIIYIN